MTGDRRCLAMALAAVLFTGALVAQTFQCEEDFSIDAAGRESLLSKYSSLAARHLLEGPASYYADFFDGRKTANGEIFRQRRFTAAHRTLPLGCWIEVKSIATGKKVRVKVNDRGPFRGGFVLDLSRIAARALGVDRAHDRRVEIAVIALPGENPPPTESDVPTGQSTEVSVLSHR